jgi:ATP-dependent Clp protease ATP-binding subunit ClpA
MQRADLEAKRLNHDCVDTGHILLGLLYDTSGVAAAVLNTFQIHAFLLAMELESLIPPGASESAAKYRRRTAGAESVLKYASEAVRELGHNYIGTEHLLLGLLCEREGLAARILAGRGLTEKEVREEIKRLLQRPDAKPRVEQPKTQNNNSLRDAERQFFLGIYRSAVDFYKPRIEKRTGIQLGDIAVWDYDVLHQHIVEEQQRQASPWRVGILRWLLRRRRLRKHWEGFPKAFAQIRNE